MRSMQRTFLSVLTFFTLCKSGNPTCAGIALRKKFLVWFGSAKLFILRQLLDLQRAPLTFLRLLAKKRNAIRVHLTLLLN
jgi:hypothetical protein